MTSRLLKLHAAQGGKSFVGIKFTRNTIDFYYPETFRWKDGLTELDDVDQNRISDDLSKGVRDILASIAFAKTLSKEKTKLNDSFDEDEEPFAMKAYLWMIRDFMRNGFYKNRESVYKLNQNGRINWKRTLRQQPIYSNGSFIYKDFVVSAKSSVENTLVEIYRFCVCKSVFLIGWLFGIRSSSLGVKGFEDVELSDALKKQYVHTLQYELSRTFDDGKRERLRNMMNVVEGLNKSENGQLVYGVDSYDRVFERMIDKIYSTEQGNMEQYYPRGQWSNGKTASPLFPDSVLHKEKTYVIIDAKCYRYADEGYADDDAKGLPSTDSIQKQLTYGDHLRKTLDAGVIYNCFIIPYNKEKQYGNKAKTDEVLLCTGLYATGLWREKSDQPYEKIYVFLADLRDVVEKWNEHHHDSEQEDLIEALEQLIKAENQATS